MISRDRDSSEAAAMSEPTPIVDFFCPRCQAVTQPDWIVCPKCGLQLRPGTDLLSRIAMWGMIFAAYVGAVVLIAKHDQDSASGFGILVGLPLCYIFGKAVIFRLSGRPLTWRHLGMTTLRTVLVSIGLLVVLPVIIGVEAILLLLAVCASMGVFH
jgi:hypothetical protein